MSTLFGNIATFYPLFVAEKHQTITSTMIGAVMGVFEFSILISSPIVAVTMQRVGRKRYILLGNACIMFSTVGFGLTHWIQNDSAFFLSSLTLRFIQGFGDAACCTGILSIIASTFPGHRDLFFGYQETAVGLGLMLGPLLGNNLYTALGYECTFYFSAIIVALPLIASYM